MKPFNARSEGLDALVEIDRLGSPSTGRINGKVTHVFDTSATWLRL
jgi:hypothetical protein